MFIHDHSHGHPHDHSLSHDELPHGPEGPPLAGSHSHTHKQTKAVLDRLARASGHLSAVRTMVEQGRDCSEVLMQLAAVRSAITKTCEVILKDHLEHCIVDAIDTGDKKALEELNRAVEMLMN